jgi:hypothetical protein
VYRTGRQEARENPIFPGTFPTEARRNWQTSDATPQRTPPSLQSFGNVGARARLPAVDVAFVVVDHAGGAKARPQRSQ